MAEVKMGIQLYTLRDFIKTAEDFDKTLSASITYSVVLTYLPTKKTENATFTSSKIYAIIASS